MGSTSSSSTEISTIRPTSRDSSKRFGPRWPGEPGRRRALQLVIRLAVPARRSIRHPAGPADQHVPDAIRSRAAGTLVGIRAGPSAPGRVPALALLRHRHAGQRHHAGDSRLRWLSFVTVAVLRPMAGSAQRRPSLTVVIPARNERGNIEAALQRMPNFGAATEVMFVEGNSTDGTWEEIQRVSALWDGRQGLRVRALQQQAKGKADAVRLGFSQASSELLTILDADLTMPPGAADALLRGVCAGRRRFHQRHAARLPDGRRSDAPSQPSGNVFFAKMLSFVLDARLGDSLCGTKMVSRHDYERFVRWRKDFGDFDPFGDFELLFPAAVLGTGIIDIPVDYQGANLRDDQHPAVSRRVYAVRMTMTGLWRIKFGSLTIPAQGFNPAIRSEGLPELRQGLCRRPSRSGRLGHRPAPPERRRHAADGDARSARSARSGGRELLVPRQPARTTSSSSRAPSAASSPTPRGRRSSSTTT